MFSITNLLLFLAFSFAKIMLSPDVEPASAQARPPKIIKQQYTVECHYAGKGKNMDWTLPVITVQDGIKTSLEDVGQKSFEYAAAQSDGANKPIKREATEGTTIEATVIGTEKNKAILDFSLQMSGNPALKDKKKDQVRWLTMKSRVIECVTLGEKTVASFEDADLEFVVEVLPENKQQTTNAPTNSKGAIVSSVPNEKL
jgi:hypothetical protein